MTSAVTTSNRDVLAGAGYGLQIGGVTTSGGNTQVQYSLTKNGVAVPGGLHGIRRHRPADTDHHHRRRRFGDELQPVGHAVVGDKVGLQPSPSLMSSIDSAIKGITNATSSTQAAQTVSQALAHMDAGIERLSNIRSYAGEAAQPRRPHHGRPGESRSIQLEADRSRAETWTCSGHLRLPERQASAWRRPSSPMPRCSACRCSTTSTDGAWGHVRRRDNRSHHPHCPDPSWVQSV